MNLRTFIERPVLSAVISITIVVVGIIGLFSLPVEQYPDGRRSNIGILLNGQAEQPDDTHYDNRDRDDCR